MNTLTGIPTSNFPKQNETPKKHHNKNAKPQTSTDQLVTHVSSPSIAAISDLKEVNLIKLKDSLDTLLSKTNDIKTLSLEQQKQIKAIRKQIYEKFTGKLYPSVKSLHNEKSTDFMRVAIQVAHHTREMHVIFHEIDNRIQHLKAKKEIHEQRIPSEALPKIASLIKDCSTNRQVSVGDISALESKKQTNVTMKYDKLITPYNETIKLLKDLQKRVLKSADNQDIKDLIAKETSIIDTNFGIDKQAHVDKNIAFFNSEKEKTITDLSKEIHDYRSNLTANNFESWPTVQKKLDEYVKQMVSLAMIHFEPYKQLIDDIEKLKTPLTPLQENWPNPTVYERRDDYRKKITSTLKKFKENLNEVVIQINQLNILTKEKRFQSNWDSGWFGYATLRTQAEQSEGGTYKPFLNKDNDQEAINPKFKNFCEQFEKENNDKNT